MTLQSDGSISMSQIQSEFGGTAPHGLSEYYVLDGLGVTGIPSSGAISFDDFYSKSNQVTTTGYVSKGFSSDDDWDNHWHKKMDGGDQYVRNEDGLYGSPVIDPDNDGYNWYSSSAIAINSGYWQFKKTYPYWWYYDQFWRNADDFQKFRIEYLYYESTTTAVQIST